MDAVDMTHVKPGDKVLRLISSADIEQVVPVAAVDAGVIYCGPQEWYDEDPKNCWMFQRETGFEIDERFGWPYNGTTGSRIVKVVE